MAAFARPEAVFADNGSAYDTIEQMIADGNMTRAGDLLTDRLVSNDKDIVALAMLGNLYRIKGERQKAISFLRKAISIDPAYPEPYLVLAKISLAAQKFDEADEQFAAFAARMKPFMDRDSALVSYYVNALQYMCGEYLALKRYGDFRAKADEILVLAPDDQATHYNLGVYQYQYRHDRSAAYGSFDRALALDPDSAVGKKARYAIEFIRANPDSRVAPDYSFVEQEFSK